MLLNECSTSRKSLHEVRKNNYKPRKGDPFWMTDYKVTLSLPDSRPHERSQVTQLKLKVGRVVGVLAPPPLRRAMGGGVFPFTLNLVVRAF